MWHVVGADRSAFTSSTTGTVYAVPGAPAQAGDLDVLFVHGEITIATPSGWTLPSGATQVAQMGSYAFVRQASAAEVVSATLTAPLNGYQCSVSWVRVRGASGTVVAASAASEFSGNDAPAATTASLAAHGWMVLAGSLMQTGGTGSGAPSNPVWAATYTPIPDASGSVHAAGPGQMSAWIGARWYASKVAQTPSVAWAGAMGLRHMIVLALEPSDPPQHLYVDEVPGVSDANQPGGLTTGVVVESAVPGSVIGWRMRHPDTAMSGTPVAGLYTITGESTGALQVSKNFTELALSDWCTTLLYDPLGVAADSSHHVDADDQFVAALWSPDRYVATNGLHSTDIARGDLTAPASGSPYSNGRYNLGGSIAFPDSSFEASGYLIDVLFVPDPDADGPTPGRTSAGFTSAGAAVKQVVAGGQTGAGLFASTVADDPEPGIAAGRTAIALTSTGDAGKQVAAGGSTTLGMFTAAPLAALQFVRSGHTAAGFASGGGNAVKRVAAGGHTAAGFTSEASALFVVHRPGATAAGMVSSGAAVMSLPLPGLTAAGFTSAGVGGQTKRVTATGRTPFGVASSGEGRIKRVVGGGQTGFGAVSSGAAAVTRSSPGRTVLHLFAGGPAHRNPIAGPGRIRVTAGPGGSITVSNP